MTAPKNWAKAQSREKKARQSRDAARIPRDFSEKSQSIKLLPITRFQSELIRVSIEIALANVDKEGNVMYQNYGDPLERILIGGEVNTKLSVKFLFFRRKP